MLGLSGSAARCPGAKRRSVGQTGFFAADADRHGDDGFQARTWNQAGLVSMKSPMQETILHALRRANKGSIG